MAGGAVALVAGAHLACGQTTPPEAPPPPTKPETETNIGRVTTAPGQGENETVVPSATTTREGALEMKRQAPNIIEVQPLSEIIKLPDVNMAEALQRIPGISLRRRRVSVASSIVRVRSAVPSVAICLRATSSEATNTKFGEVERKSL